MAEPGAGGPGELTARSLARRLAAVLHDLGLLGTVVPDGWVGVERAAVTFGDLDMAAAGRLLGHLEDLAALVTATGDARGASGTAAAGPQQGSFFGVAR